MQTRVTFEATVVTSALIEHSVVVFSPFPVEINKDQKTVADRENKQKNPVKEPTHSSFHLTKHPLLVGTHTKYSRSSKGDITESEFLICPEKASVVSNTELLGRKLIIIIWWSDRFLQ